MYVLICVLKVQDVQQLRLLTACYIEHLQAQNIPA